MHSDAEIGAGEGVSDKMNQNANFLTQRGLKRREQARCFIPGPHHSRLLFCGLFFSFLLARFLPLISLTFHGSAAMSDFSCIELISKNFAEIELVFFTYFSSSAFILLIIELFFWSVSFVFSLFGLPFSLFAYVFSLFLPLFN